MNGIFGGFDSCLWGFLAVNKMNLQFAICNILDKPVGKRLNSLFYILDNKVHTLNEELRIQVEILQIANCKLQIQCFLFCVANSGFGLSHL